MAPDIGKRTLRVEMLGWLQAQAGRTVIGRFRTRKTAALFAYLAYHSDVGHPRERLVEMLWPDAREETRRNSLSQALTSLRHDLARAGANGAILLEAGRASVQLHARTDVAEFREAVATSGTRLERIRALTRAQELYRGELLPGHYDAWTLAERVRLRELFAGAMHELVSLLRAEGNLPAAVATAHRAVREDPISELAVRDMMQAHLDANEPRLALRAYHELEAALERELDERPSAPTRELARQIVAASEAGGAAPRGAGEPAASPFPASDTVTFLLLLASPAAIVQLRTELAANGGALLGDEADRIVAAFAYPSDALACALAVRRKLEASPDPEEVRIAIDTFLRPAPPRSAEVPEESVAWLASAARAGRIVLGEAAAALLRGHLPPGLRLRESVGSSAERLYLIAFPQRKSA